MTELQTESSTPVFGRLMRIVGWLCVVGMAAVIVEMLSVLPFMQEPWWTPPDAVNLGPGEFGLRTGVMHPGLLGWAGAWGYWAAWVWIPVAVWRAIGARRRGTTLRSRERVLLALVPVLFLAVQGIFRLTRLRYEYPLI